jgi:hypothetical protein
MHVDQFVAPAWQCVENQESHDTIGLELCFQRESLETTTYAQPFVRFSEPRN